MMFRHQHRRLGLTMRDEMIGITNAHVSGGSVSVDSVPTQGSTRPLASGGAYTYCVRTSDNQTVGGIKTLTSDLKLDGNRQIMNTADNTLLRLQGGSGEGKGGRLVVSGMSRSGYQGYIELVGDNGTNNYTLCVTPKGINYDGGYVRYACSNIHKSTAPSSRLVNYEARCDNSGDALWQIETVQNTDGTHALNLATNFHRSNSTGSKWTYPLKVVEYTDGNGNSQNDLYLGEGHTTVYGSANIIQRSSVMGFIDLSHNKTYQPSSDVAGQLLRWHTSDWNILADIYPVYASNTGYNYLHFRMSDHAGSNNWVCNMLSNGQLHVATQIASLSCDVGGAQYRAIHGNYGYMIRNDGQQTYGLVTANGDPWGTWTSARPWVINNSTGVMSINGNAATATTAGSCTGKSASADKVWCTGFSNDCYLRLDWSDGANRWNAYARRDSSGETWGLHVAYADNAGSAGSVAWGNVSGKPAFVNNGTTSAVAPSAALTNGFWYVSSSTSAHSGADANPLIQYHTGNNDFRIITSSHNDSWLQQIATDFRTDHIYFRRKENGTWKDWCKIYTTADVLVRHAPEGVDSAGVRMCVLAGWFQRDGTEQTVTFSGLSAGVSFRDEPAIIVTPEGGTNPSDGWVIKSPSASGFTIKHDAGSATITWWHYVAVGYIW